MTEDLNPLLEAAARQRAEAIVHAEEIKEKVQKDNSTGWYSLDRPEKTSGQMTAEFLQKGAARLKKVYGANLAAYICGLERTQPLAQWAKGDQQPNLFQSQQLRSVIEVTDILLTRMTPAAVKQWMTTPNTYLDPIVPTLPMDEIRVAAEFVRRAALYELVH